MGTGVQLLASRLGTGLTPLPGARPLRELLSHAKAQSPQNGKEGEWFLVAAALLCRWLPTARLPDQFGDLRSDTRWAWESRAEQTG